MTDGSPPLPAAWSGRSAAQWAAYIGVPRIEIHASLPSTNRWLLEQVGSGLEPFTTVVAGTQTQGRGRVGRAWHSPEGAGLWLSILVPPGPGGEVGVLPLAVGVAAAEALERFVPAPVGLKWPNDLLIRDRKVAGILCEGVPEPDGRGVVVGIGINVRRPDGGYPKELEGSVGTLEGEGGRPVSEPELARAFVRSLRRHASPPPPRLTGPLRVAWDGRDRLRGQDVRMERGVEGRVVGVTDDGSLEIREESGRTVLARAGTVRLTSAGASAALHGHGEGETGGRPGKGA